MRARSAADVVTLVPRDIEPSAPDCSDPESQRVLELASDALITALAIQAADDWWDAATASTRP